MLLLLPAAGCPNLRSLWTCGQAAALTCPTCLPPPNAAAHHYFPVQVVYEDRQALENTDHPYVIGGWRGRRSGGAPGDACGGQCGCCGIVGMPGGGWWGSGLRSTKSICPREHLPQRLTPLRMTVCSPARAADVLAAPTAAAPAGYEPHSVLPQGIW